MPRHPESPRSSRLRPGAWSDRRRSALRFLAGAPGMDSLEERKLMATFSVTNANDSGAGSLRQAILDANSAAGTDTVAFNIPGPGPYVIQPHAQGGGSGIALPVIVDAVTIDGTTQPGYAGAPIIQIDGALADDGILGTFGLNIQAPNSTARGLSITGFPNRNGNGFGIGLFNNGATITTNVAIEGCYIGLKPDGTAAGNGQGGVWIGQGANGNRIGTNSDGANDAAEGNVISANAGMGILAQSPNDVIAGNKIGTDPSGTVARGNTGDGILMNSGSPGATIGGTAASAGNVISGNGAIGVELSGFAVNSTLIQGNRIGTDATGANALGNSFGVYLQGSGSNTIGGVTAAAANVISGNAGGSGVAIVGNAAAFNRVIGNFIGVDTTGSTALGNSRGVTINDAPGNTIGGTLAGAGNVISGNTAEGALILGSNATGNLVTGNLIGLDFTGATGLGNGSTGLHISGASGNTIGAANAVDASGNVTGLYGNLIAGGSAGTGVVVYQSSGTRILGNRIGTDRTGNTRVASVDGIALDLDANTTIGGATAGAGNLISGNARLGLYLEGSTNAAVYGNRIGTNAGGTAALANGSYGIIVNSGGSGATIGGTTTAARNVILGGSGAGIEADNAGGAPTGLVIVGNYIGTDTGGDAALGQSDGVLIKNVPGVTVGASGAGNLISGNTGNGVFLTGSGTTGTVVAGNRIGTDFSGLAPLPGGGPVAWYRAEGSGKDSAGSHDATPVGVTYGAGQLGQAFGLDGALGYVATPLTVNYATGVTYDVWFKTTAAGNPTIMSDGGGATAESGMGLFLNNGVAQLYGNNGVGGGYNFIISNTSSNLNDGRWHHLTATWTGSTTANGVKLYVDGALSGQATAAAAIATGSRTLALGGHGQLAFQKLAGQIDEASVFSRVLTPAEVAQIQAAGGHGVAVPNTDGIGIDLGATGNTIGGVTAAARNLISGNAQSGISLAGGMGAGNRVAGDYIGTDATGAFALANGTGIAIGGSAALIGTDGDGVNDAAERNVISGNTSYGVNLNGATNNKIAGNYIGLNAAGTAALVNGFSSVATFFSTGNIIGTDGSNDAFNPDERNVISNGVILQNANVLAGNYIGLNAAGTAALSVSGAGVQVSGTTGSRVGTNADGVADAEERNVIAGISGDGLIVSQPGAIIAGNYIGTNAAGTVAIPNSRGIHLVSGADGTRIGTNSDGTNDAAEANVIAGNAGAGVDLDGVNAAIAAGNLIGLNAAGTAAMPNAGGGVSLHNAATSNTIGGAVYAARNVISGNAQFGVSVAGAGTNNNRIQGNNIGTNVAGTASLVPLAGLVTYGVEVSGSAIGTIIGTDGDGTNDATEGNVISGNGYGVFLLSGATATVIAGNRVSTNANGDAAIGNAVAGIRVANGTVLSTRIGTDGNGVSDALERNVIAGTIGADGNVYDAGTSTVIAGNYIGTNAAGTASLGGYGLSLGGAVGPRVGTNADGLSDAAERNVISGNLGAGIFVFGTTNATIAGNYIGLNAAGTAAMPNYAGAGWEGLGVRIYSGSTGTTLGGSSAATRNVISGNAGGGVLLTGALTTGNLVAGNYIGTDPAGTASIENADYDVTVGYGAGGNTIGGLADDGAGNPAPGTGPGNVIASSGSAAGATYHVLLDGDNNAVLGNLIGTDASGTVALSYDYGSAVTDYGANNTIGGPTPNARNIISGNAAGISLVGSGTVVLSNYIGPDVTGLAKLGTKSYGLYINGASNVTIGAPGAGNILSGSASYGSYIVNTTNLLVQGNLIGTDKTGVTPMPSYIYDLLLYSGTHNFTIGGTALGAGNVISGNAAYDGLGISYADTGLIQGNFIGTDPTGMIAVPNGNGIDIGRGSSNITVGGTAAAARNIISGNTQFGVELTGGTNSSIVVLGNYIGTKADGAHALPNGTGINLSASTRLDTIGGTAAGAGNVISGNTRAGISIDGTGAPDYPVIWFPAEGNTNNSANTSGPGATTGTVTYGPGVAGGQAFAFSRSTPGYVSAQFISFATPASAVTVEGWINPATLPAAGQEYLLVDNGNPASPNVAVLLTNSGGAARLAFRYATSGGGQTVLSAPLTLATGTFRHAAVTSDGASVRFYLDGALFDTEAFVGTAAVSNSTALDQTDFVGGDSGATPHTFDGRIDEIALYQRALRPDEIAHIFAAGGVDKGGSGVQQITVQGNFIGTNKDGKAALGNGGDGIKIQNSFSNFIGGAGASTRNIISGNGQAGIFVDGIDSADNTLAGNYIGLDFLGQTAIPNRGDGVRIRDAVGTSVGGLFPSMGNVISGNDSGNPSVPVHGIEIQGASGGIIAGNRIGTDAGGTLARPNSGDGVYIFGSSGVTIGGTSANARNVISANGADGVFVAGLGDSAILVAGNYLGTDLNGTSPLPNTSAGVHVLGASNDTTIGGTAAGASNVISGGIYVNRDTLLAAIPQRTLIQGNLVGRDRTGTAIFPNSGGIGIDEAQATTIGGSVAGAGNIISGGAWQGVQIVGNLATGNLVLGNRIGSDDGGAAGSGDVGPGVLVQNASNNTIGAAVPGAGNTITGNGDAGVVIVGGNRNPIRGNAIFGNTGLGILLQNATQPVPNDPGDVDSGPNDFQNYPVLTTLSIAGGVTRIGGTLDSLPGGDYQVDFYTSPAPGPGGYPFGGYGLGKTYLGTIAATTYGAGDGSFLFQYPGLLSGAGAISATATDAAGNTSELSLYLANDRAPVARIRGGDRGAPAASPVTFLSDSTDPDAGDSLTLSWSFGDGSHDATGASVAHAFAASGTYHVILTAVDQFGGISSDNVIVTTTSGAPVVGPLTLGAIDEDGLATANVSFVEPDPTRSAVADIDWGDLSPPTHVTLSAGVNSFAASHRYLDGTPSDYRVAVTVTDSAGQTGTAVATQRVENVAPTLSGVRLDRATIAEGGEARLTGFVTDPGSLDGHTIQITWGDGLQPEETTIQLLPGQTAFEAVRTYTDVAGAGGAASYAIGVVARDKDGGSAATGAAITVTNVAPTVSFFSSAAPGIAPGLRLSALVSDPGALDSFSFMWTANPGGLSGAGPVFDFPSTAFAAYNVTLTVRDKNGASSSFSSLVVTGSDGNDRITLTQPSAGQVTVDNGFRSNTFPATAVEVVALSGDDVIDASAVSIPVALDGGPGDDLLAGGSGNDTLVGGPGNNRINGGDGDDLFLPNPFGYDILGGGLGNDTYQIVGNPAGGDPTLNETGGIDTLDFSKEPAGVGVTVNLNVTGTSQTFDTQGTSNALTLNGQFENIVGTSSADTLYANSTTGSKIVGGAGDDQLYGGSGNDQLYAGTGDVTMTAGGGDDQLYGGYGTTSMSSGTGNATMYGGYGNATMSSAGGNATMYGSYGNSSMNSGTGNATMYGSYGNATMSSSSGNATMYGSAGNTSMSTGGGNATMYGSAGNTSMSSGSGNATMYGSYGNTSMSTGGGNATMYGSAGNTSMTSGSANATMYGGYGNTTMNSGSGNATMYGSAGNTSMSTGGGNATMYGSAGNTTMSSGSANSTMYGGYGNATMSSSSGNATMYGSYGNATMSSSGGNATMYGGYGNSSIGSSGGNATMYGSAGNTTMSSGGANATMYGGYGNSSMSNGSGNATMYGGYGNATMSSGSGNATMYGSYGNSSMSTGGGNATMYGGYGNTSMGSSGGNATMYGSYGNTSMSTGSGNATMYGSVGNTTMGSAGGNATMYGGYGNTSMSSGTGNATMYGSYGNTTMSSSTGNATMYGGAGNTTMVGGPGNDSMVGGSGRTTMYAGTGDDNVVGGTGEDTLIAQSDADVTVTASRLTVPGQGSVTFRGIEQVELIAGDRGQKLDASGATVPVDLVGGAGNDTLIGGAGDDRLEGGAGDDLLIGNGGGDTYVFGSGPLGSDRVMEASNSDSDTLDFAYFSGSVVLDLRLTTPQRLGNGLLTLTLSDATAIENVVGGAYDDAITGNARDNLLVGAGGVDSLYGGDGDDTLSAGRVQTVFLDFDTFSYPGAHVYTPSERDAIQARLAGDYADFTYRFTQVRPHSGAFATVFFNRPLGDYSGGSSNEIDWRNLAPGGVATVDVNQFVRDGVAPPITTPTPTPTSAATNAATAFLADGDLPANTGANVVALSATIAAHELGHLSGLEHEDAFGAIGSGAYPRIQYDKDRQFLPPYTGPYAADETSAHLMGSPASIRTDLFQAAGSPYLGEREAIKLAFADHGSVVGEQSAPHQAMDSAQVLDVAALAVPNTLLGGLYAGADLHVFAVDVVGSIRLDATGHSEDDYYAFDATAGSVINLQVFSAGLARIAHPIDSILRVFDASGHLLDYYGSPAVDDDSFESPDAALLDLRIPADGRYFVQVDTYTGPGSDGVFIPDNHSGDYELLLTDFRAPTTAAIRAAATAAPSYRPELLDGGVGTNTLIGGSGPVVFANSGAATPITNGPGAVVDAAPQNVSIGPARAVTNGASVSLTSEFSDADDASGFTYLWHVDADNGRAIADGATEGFGFTATAPGTYTVTFTVTDPHGARGEAVAVIAAVGDASTAEGTPYTLDLAALSNAVGGGAQGWTIHWGDGTPDQVIAGDPSAVTHAFADGPATNSVVATATTATGSVVAPTFAVSVTNVAPTVAISGPTTGVEGSPIALTGIATDPSSVDTAAGFTYAWSVKKDGAAFASGPGSAVAFTPDDNGTYTVCINATDKDYLTGAAATRTITVANVAPTIALGASSPTSGMEGAAVRLTASATDPSTVDAANLTFAWSVTKDGSAYGTGSGPAFVFTPDDNGLYVVTATATDKDGGVSAATTDEVVVVNVAPAGLALTASQASISEGDTLTLGGSFTDPGSRDAHAVDIDWGDGSAHTVVDLAAGAQSFADVAHTYVNNPAGQPMGSDAIRMIVADKDGASVSAATSVQVRNAAPSGIVATPDASAIDENGTVAVSGRFVDPGVLDTHTVTVGWGDGSPDTVLNLAAGVLTYATPAHRYLDNRPADAAYPIAVTVSDGDGGQSAVSAPVTVRNRAPVVGAPANRVVDMDVSATFALGSFSDPGTLDGPWTVGVNWGDGSPVTTLTATAAGSLGNATHTFIVDGVYTVTVRVADKDGAVGAATFTATATPGVLLLDRTMAGALTVSGGAVLTSTGRVVVDSSSPSAIMASGSAQVKASGIAVAGGYSLSGGASLGAAPQTGAAVTADPLSGLARPTVTAVRGSVDVSNGSVTLNPGVYTSIKVSGKAVVTLNPGSYVVAGGGLSVSGNGSLVGDGVMLFNAGSNYGTSATSATYGGIALTGNGTLRLSGPADGLYRGIVLFQPAENTRAISLSGGAAAGLTGAVYAPSALLAISGGAQIHGSFIADALKLTGSSTATLTADGSAGGDASWVVGQLLGADLHVFVADPSGLFTADERARIDDAIAGLEALLAPYAVTVAEVGDPALANVVIETAAISAVGGAADGVLGCTTDGGRITLVQGWDEYAGADASAIGLGQYDFQTIVTHELGHVLGLGHSVDAASTMFGTLAPGQARRSLVAADLNIPDGDGGPDGLHAAPGAIRQTSPETSAPATRPADAATVLGGGSSSMPIATAASRSHSVASFHARPRHASRPSRVAATPAASAEGRAAVRDGGEGEHAISLHDLALEQVVTRVAVRRPARGRSK